MACVLFLLTLPNPPLTLFFIVFANLVDHPPNRRDGASNDTT
jgi:hypothetical protein